MDGGEIVVVTGFGPFRQFLVNPSWKAALVSFEKTTGRCARCSSWGNKDFKYLISRDFMGLKLVGLGEGTEVYTKELPVSYVKAQQIIAEIWQTLKPKFAVHLGVARGSSVVTVEQTAKNCGYRDKDVCGCCPESHCCVEGGPEKLDSVVNMRAACKALREAGMDVIYSRDAGRYLCDFAYYCSLYHGRRRAALIHVPSSGGLTSADRLLPLLQSLVQTMLGQLERTFGKQRQETMTAVTER